MPPKEVVASQWTSAQTLLIRKWTVAATEVSDVLELGRSALVKRESVEAFRSRFTILEKYYSRFEAYSDQLYDLNPQVAATNRQNAEATTPPTIQFSEFPDQKQSNVLKNVRTYYLECIDIHGRLCSPRPCIPSPPSTSQDITIQPELVNTSLPRISIPRFSGKYSEWIQFRDTFTSLVHDTPLSQIKKFHYLVGALTGPAKSVIASFPISEANYLPAFNALKETYENKRILANLHLQRLFNVKTPTAKPTAASLQDFLAQVSDTISALRLLEVPDPAEFMYYHLAARGLDPFTREQFEFRLKRDQFPTEKELAEFVRERQLALQLCDSSKGESSSAPSSSRNNAKTRTSLLTGAAKPKRGAPSVKPPEPTNTCPSCSEEHGLPSCPKFLAQSPVQRFNALRKWHGCRNCLSSAHHTHDCKAPPKCTVCQKAHNPKLCMRSTSSATGNDSSTNLMGASLVSKRRDDGESPSFQVVLGTALALIVDARGELQTIRLVIDSASQYSYITQRCLNKLGLKMRKTQKQVSCLGGTLFEGAKGVLSCQIRSSRVPQVELSTEALVIPNIISFLPTVPVPAKIRSKYSKFELADPQFFNPAAIDFLAGADLFPQILSGRMSSVGNNVPQLMETIFGMVVIGRYPDPYQSTAATSLMTFQNCDGSTCFDLKQFWEIEDVPTSSTQPGSEDEAELHFRKTYSRQPNGKFEVRLPFKHAVPDLSYSEELAKRRFFALEAKLQKDPDLYTQYKAFIKEYEQLGHCSPASTSAQYVIPHHGVFNKNKLRVVFDCSCSTRAGSLNQHLLVGPPLQNDIRNILLNFRAYRYAFITDAVKMYRQIIVAPQDRGYQHILWRDNPSLPLQRYELNTVTYGMSCSPFLALRCLKQLEIENVETFPLAARALSTQLYVDDIAAGGASEEEVLELQQQLTTVMGLGGFPLAKWASNSKAVMARCPSDGSLVSTSVDLSPVDNTPIKVLGLKWDPVTDMFSYNITRPDIPATKRGILSTVARVFDPLGFLAPATISLKILIQQLWSVGVDWDQQIPIAIEDSWKLICEQLHLLSIIQVPRFVTAAEPFSYQLIGFCDSSESAYCAVIYIRIISAGAITVHLLTAKTKVAPTKKLTIPKLELCGALLLARLHNSVSQFHDTIGPRHLRHPPMFFTDSMVALTWVTKTPILQLKVFVANRASEIRNLTDPTAWRHIPGSENPADIGSRGVSPANLVDHPLWWCGPEFLTRPIDSWPDFKGENAPFIPELKGEKGHTPPHISLISCSALPEIIAWMSRFSSYRRLIHVTALILRVVHNRRHSEQPKKGEYSLFEVTQAFLTCVKLVQSYHFLRGDDSNFPTVQLKCKSLNLFIDSYSVIRVGGRLHNANLPYQQKHPIILPHDSHFVRLLLDFFHHTYMHAGPSLLQTLLQQRFWIPGMRRLTRTVVRKCVECFKLRAPNVVPMMGNLPPSRLSAVRPFLHTGMDFAGPFSMRESSRRKALVSKVYLCIFVCMSTKAVHLEAVTSLSTEAFLASLNRFISRRGVPSDLYSDNGTNFVGASRELQALLNWYNQETTHRDIARFTVGRGINFHFSPPYTPHFGGLWEAGVKSVKHHLTLMIKDTPLTYEEFSTLLCQVESILNSRPLCPLSEDADNFDVLTPGHFIIGAPMVALPEPSLLNERLNKLSRWQLVKRFTEEMWARWHAEYLSTLQRRSKWHRDPAVYIQPGDLVLVREKDSPPLRWPTARVLTVTPGRDRRPRVADIQTPTGVYTRGVINLIPLVPANERREPSL